MCLVHTHIKFTTHVHEIFNPRVLWLFTFEFESVIGGHQELWIPVVVSCPAILSPPASAGWLKTTHLRLAAIPTAADRSRL